jgi:metal-sulfur cluster biosynthetic enzyme
MVDIWTLGLIYDVKVEDGEVKIKMTYTTPTCPWGPQMVEDLKKKISERGAARVDIEVTFDPPWQPKENLRKLLGV